MSIEASIRASRGDLDLEVDLTVGPGGDLYFIVDGASGPSELWRSNGTESGTSLVAALPGTGAALTTVGARLFFSVQRADGHEHTAGAQRQVKPVGERRATVVVGAASPERGARCAKVAATRFSSTVMSGKT